MTTTTRTASICLATGLLLAVPLTLSGNFRRAENDSVHALFDLSSPTTAPFPSDWLTVLDSSQNTGRRVNLANPDCGTYPSDCEDIGVINTLDGFHVVPRLSIPFDGPIDVNTATSDTIILLPLEDGSCHDEHRQNHEEGCERSEHDQNVVGIDQVVWDPDSHVLYAQSADMLRQHHQYALLVTRGIRDQNGRAVEATETFRHLRHTAHGAYQRALLNALEGARRLGLDERDIVSASVFTTQTITTVLEKIRDQIKTATPDPADFLLDSGGTRTVFPVESVSAIAWHAQTGADPPKFTDVSLNGSLSLLQVVPGSVSRIAFGKYLSPDFEVHPGEFIPPIGTRTGTPQATGVNAITFDLFVPSGPKPAAGWPVAIFGHGNGQTNTLGFAVASVMAAHGVATIAINAVGHGFGPLSTLTVSRIGGPAVTFPTGGRGIDQNGDHVIGANEGLFSAPPRTVIQNYDGLRQTAADLMQLVRVIQVGMDIDGDGAPDVDASRIFYFAHSVGTAYGLAFLAVEPSVKAGDLTSLAAPIPDIRRLSPAFRPSLGQLWASRIPSLLNEPGVTTLGGIPIGPPRFDDNLPLPNGAPTPVTLADGTSREIRSPVTNDVPGALAIQQALESARWVGNPVAYAPLLRRAPLAGVPLKSVLIQFGKGDLIVPNPVATVIVRAGGLADRTTFYRHDVAYTDNPMLPKDSHSFMTSTGVPAFRSIAVAAQEQIAIFFATDGTQIIQPQPARYFEAPIALPLPTELNFIR